ncbi:hypothetical protein GCM10009603_58050 [Nocardiopsis exhalans]
MVALGVRDAHVVYVVGGHVLVPLLPPGLVTTNVRAWGRFGGSRVRGADGGESPFVVPGEEDAFRASAAPGFSPRAAPPWTAVVCPRLPALESTGTGYRFSRVVEDVVEDSAGVGRTPAES